MRLVALLVIASLSGCVGHRAALEKALRADSIPLSARDREARYLVRFPDVLDVQVCSRPDCCGTRPVGVEGAIWLAAGSQVHAAGQSAPTIARLVARKLEVAEGDVAVRVTRHESQQLFLVGGEGAIQKAFAYRGPETVVELLRRVDGLAEMDLDDVRVVRAHVADGKPPEVFPVDLAAILLKKESRTNVQLEPFDRVYVGQSQRARIACKLPPWLLPLCMKPSPPPLPE